MGKSKLTHSQDEPEFFNKPVAGCESVERRRPPRGRGSPALTLSARNNESRVSNRRFVAVFNSQQKIMGSETTEVIEDLNKMTDLSSQLKKNTSG